MSRRAGARVGRLLFRSACVTILLTLAISGAATAAHHGKTMLVGIVLPEGCLPNHPCTASLVTNPDDIAGTPGLVVRKVRVPEHKDSHGHATLEGEVISGAHREHQPANEPITFVVPETGAPTLPSLEVSLANEPNETVALAIRELPPARAKSPARRPTMAPVVPDNGVCVVHDKLTGDGRATRIKVNGVDVPALAESPSVLAFVPEDALQTGENRIVVVNGGSTKTYKAWDPDLTIDSDKTTLEQSESTEFRVKLNLGRMPNRYWGNDAILVTIKNDSQDTATMSGGDVVTVPVHVSDLADGIYTYKGTITAKEPGQFEIEAETQSELADAPPVSVSETPPNQYAADSGETPTTEQTPAAKHRLERTPVAEETPSETAAAPTLIVEQTPSTEQTPVAPAESGPPATYVPGVPPPNEPGESPPTATEGIPVANPTPTSAQPYGSPAPSVTPTASDTPSVTPSETPTPSGVTTNPSLLGRLLIASWTCKAPFTSNREVPDGIYLDPPPGKSEAYGKKIGCDTKPITVEETESIPIYWIIAGKNWSPAAAAAKRTAAATWFKRYCIRLDFRELALTAELSKALISDLDKYADDPDKYTFTIWHWYYGSGAEFDADRGNKTGELYNKIYATKAMKNKAALLVMFVDPYLVRGGERGGGEVDNVSLNFMDIPVILISSEDGLPSKHILTHELTHGLGKLLGIDHGRLSEADIDGLGYTWDHVDCEKNMDDAQGVNENSSNPAESKPKVPPKPAAGGGKGKHGAPPAKGKPAPPPVGGTRQPLTKDDDAPVDWAAYYEWRYGGFSLGEGRATLRPTR